MKQAYNLINAYESRYFEYELYFHKISIVDPFATTPGDGSGKAKLATVAAALLKAKKSGQLPSAFGDIVLPGLDDEDAAGPDGNLNSNNDTQPLPQRNENGIQGKNPNPKLSVTSQGGGKQPGGQQPLRSVHVIHRHLKKLTPSSGFLGDIQFRRQRSLVTNNKNKRDSFSPPIPRRRLLTYDISDRKCV